MKIIGLKMKLNLNKITAYKNKLILPLFFLIFGIWILPWPYSLPSFGLDPSWVIGLYKAAADGMQFGYDIAFTLGPLGFLYRHDYIDPNLWLLSFEFAIFVHFLFIFSFALFMARLSATWKEYFIVIPILFISIPFLGDYEVMLSAVMIFFLVAENKLDKRYESYLLSFLALLLAIVSLIKFNMTMISLSIILSFLFMSFLKKDLKKHLHVLISYFAFVIILWKLAGQSIFNLPIYFHYTLQSSSGYSDAMVIQGPSWQVYLGITCIIFIIILFYYSLINKANNLLVFLFLNVGMFFLAFKHGFVRHDGHVLFFLSTYAILLICIYLILTKIPLISSAGRFTYGKNSNFLLKCISLSLSLLLVTSIYFFYPGIIGNNIFQKVPAYESTFSLISNQSYQTQILENSKSSIRQNYPLDNGTVKYLNNKTLDIFPWDIALIWAYNFTWSPRPVFQSYSAYTEHLDKLNAEHFSKEKAPQVLLYSFKSIDWRYPLFDEPATFAAVLNNYTFVNKSGEFLILSYNPKENTTLIEQDLGTLKVEPGQPIKIPKYNEGYVFGQIQLDYSIYGGFMKFIYKPSLANIRFKFSDSLYSNSFRFIPGVSMNGVFLSQYVETTDDLASIFSGNITPNINEIVIDVDNPDHYKKYIQVKFIGVPANVSIQKNPYSIPQWDKLERKEGGIMAIDSIVNRDYANKRVLLMNREIGVVGIYGWAVDDLAKDGNVRTYIIFRSKEEEITLPTAKMLRQDVSKYFGIESYEQSGWSINIRQEQFKDKCYDVLLRILRANGEEYYELSGNRSICWMK